MRTLCFFYISIAFISCNNSKQEQVINPNELIIQQYYQHFNNHDWIKMANMYADTTEFKDPSLGKEIFPQNRQQIIEKYTALNTIFPNIKDEVVNIYPSDSNHIIVEFVSTGTAADKSTFKLPICTIFTIKNGFITKDFTYYDNFDE
jgi:hypothetical protein